MRLLLTLPLMASIPAVADDAPAVGADAASAAEDAVQGVLSDQQCSEMPADTGLHHLRCGETRLLVAQLSEVESDVHDEVLTSVLDLVPAPATRSEVSGLDHDLRVTRVVQSRAALERDELSVLLVLTTRRSTGRSVACAVGQLGRRRTDRAEVQWCEQVTAALLPPPTGSPATTRIEVREPDLPDADELAPADGSLAP